MRVIIYIIPSITILYILYVNLYVPVIPDNSTDPKDANSTIFTIKVGDLPAERNIGLLEPFERISGPFSKNNVTYRLIEKDLVYFSSPVKQNFSKVKVEVKFIDTIPEGYELKVGLKNKKEWSYLWNTLYNPFYTSVETFNLTGEDSRFRIYSLSSNLTMPVSTFLASPPYGSTIATEVPVKLSISRYDNYKDSASRINELRDDHTFYIYTKGNFSLSVEKQDLNWYNGSDALEIKLYSPTNALIKNITVPDDGNSGDSKSTGYLQNTTLEDTLEEGMYKVTMMGGGDYLIRSIELNNGNIVAQNPFLAGISYTNTTRFHLYTKAAKDDRFGFITYHTEGLQTINISRKDYIKRLNITSIKEWHYIDLPSSNEIYEIEIPEGDITINSNGFFSFSNDSYFDPQAAKILTLQNSMGWLKTNKVDYIIISNRQIVKDGNWTIANTEYNLSDAYIENNTLNFAISAPHLGKYNYSIPIDWIKIYMEK